MVNVNPPTITVIEASLPQSTPAQQVLTTINWVINPTSLPYTGGMITATITCLDQNNNPIANITGITLNEQNVGAVAQFPATNTSGLSQVNVIVPANSTYTSQSLVFFLTGY